jgi:hypothetical protein
MVAILRWQAHGGAVNTGSTPQVGATYANGSTNTVRGTSFVYPNGRALTFDYGTAGGIDDRLSRIAVLVDDDATHLAEYQYLGLGAVVQIDSPQPNLRMTLVDLSGANDPDTGDRLFCHRPRKREFQEMTSRGPVVRGSRNRIGTLKGKHTWRP